MFILFLQLSSEHKVSQHIVEMLQTSCAAKAIYHDTADKPLYSGHIGAQIRREVNDTGRERIGEESILGFHVMSSFSKIKVFLLLL